MTTDEMMKASQRLWRQYVKGTITGEHYQIESLKLAVDHKERQFLYVAVQVLEARMVLGRVAEELEHERGPNATAEEIGAFLAEVEASHASS